MVDKSFQEEMHKHVSRVLFWYLREGETYIRLNFPDPENIIKLLYPFLEKVEQDSRFDDLKRYVQNESYTAEDRFGATRYAIDPEKNKDALIIDWREFYAGTDVSTHLSFTGTVFPIFNEAMKPIISGDSTIPTVCVWRVPKYENCKKAESFTR